MHIAVLGAGVIGVTTAYYLQQAGHEVTVIERNAYAAAECSFANGGQLSYSHAQPWANPATLRSIPKLLMSKNSPLEIGKPFSADLWRWVAGFVAACSDEKSLVTSRKLLDLALTSQSCLEGLMEETGIDFQKNMTGTIHLYRTETALKGALAQAEFQADLGCPYQLLDSRKACEVLEPALRYSDDPFIGGIYFPIDASGDIHQFTLALADILAKRGVKFQYHTSIKQAVRDGDVVTKLETSTGDIHADAYVVALGAYSGVFLRGLGVRLPMYPVKGYSLTLPIFARDKVPHICLTDTHNKIVLSRLGDHLRIAGTAEFSGFDHSIRADRIATLKALSKRLCPEGLDYDNARQWACLRPATPTGMPLIGRSALRNLHLNTGHGNLGWTLAAGSGYRLANGL